VNSDPTDPRPDPDPQPSRDGEFEGALQAAKNGDREALEALLQDSLPDLNAWLKRKVGGVLRDRESISDLAQSVCREVLKDLDKFENRGPAAFRSWLLQQAGRKVVDRYRYHQRESRSPSREHSEAEPDALIAEDPSPSRVLAAKDEMGRVRAALATLPDTQREAIVLHRLMGLDYAEISRRMERSEAAVRALVARGLADLAQRL